MSRDRHSDQPISAEELLLVEALYGEVPDSEVSRTEELEGLRGLRSMFADLPEEEPPSAISAKLMSAAAEAVKARAPDKPGLWARLLALFQPIAAHPALAAAASLVLVVTIGGVMVMTGRSRVAEPDTKSATPASYDTGAAPADEFKDKAVDLPASEPETMAAEPEPEPKPNVAGQGEKPRERATTPGRTGSANAPAPPPVEKKPDNSKGGGGVDGRTGLDFDLDGEQEKGEDSRDDAPDDRNGRGTATAMEQQQRKATISARVERLTSDARKAADKRNCDEVKNLTAQIKPLDANTYTALLRETAIRTCVEPKIKKGKK